METNKTDYFNEITAMSTLEHPVWNLYDELRTARLNVRYYETKLSSVRRNNIIIEFVLALSVSSGIAGLWLWQNAVGGFIWKGLVTLAAFLAVLKPLIKLSDEIQHKSEILTSWRLLDDGLRNLMLQIKERSNYDEELLNRFHAMMETKTTIIQREPLERIDEKLRIKCFRQVCEELPVDDFFIP